jgi:hypothetical protein
MALKTTTHYLKKEEQKSFDNAIGVINNSNTPVYYNFEEMDSEKLGVPLINRGDEDKFPPQKVWVRATRQGSFIAIMEEA